MSAARDPVGAMMSAKDEVDGTSWQLERLVMDGSMARAIPGVSVTLTFRAGSVTGFGGCNSFFGAYEVEGESLGFGDLGSTQAICDDEVGTSDQELSYLRHLGSVDRYRIENDRLILGQRSTDLVVLSSLDP